MSDGSMSPAPPPPPPSPPPFYEGSSRPSRRWYHSPLVVVAALVLFFPIGLVLTWTHPEWTKRTKWAISGAVAVIAVVGIALPKTKKPATSRVAGTTATSTAPTTERPSTTAAKPTTTAEPTTPAQPTTTAAPSTAPAPVTSGSDLKAQVTAWTRENHGDVSKLASFYSSVTAAVGGGDLHALRNACSDLQGQAEVTKVDLPAPDPELTNELTQALDALDTGALDCVNGVDNLQPSLLQSAGTQFQLAGPHISAASVILNRYRS